MDAEFWHERWASGSTRFNQAAVHPMLAERWRDHVHASGGAVFVPLCGKSIDMEWLASIGHDVVGVELSPIAVSEFFAERGMRTDERTEGELTVHSAGPYELWCGDIFEMPPSALDGVVAVYDRASLVALPTEMRRRYAAHLTEVVPHDAPIFLVSFEYDQREMDGPPFSVTTDETADLYRDAFDIDVVASSDVIERNPDLRARGLSRLTETLSILSHPA